MLMKRHIRSALVALMPMSALSALAIPTVAQAHISIVSGPGFANTTQEITFGVGHGCAGADTYRVRVAIPAGISSVRPETSGFGKISLEKDTAGTITAVIWQKADQDLLPADIEYYKLTMRLRVPDRPFTTLYFPAHQTCRAADGTMTTVGWTTLPGATPTPDASAGAEEDEPSPALSIVPARRAGWNKFTVAAAVADLNALFGDAQIVWKGNAAFSANPAISELITATAGVTALTALAANDVVWVKY